MQMLLVNFEGFALTLSGLVKYNDPCWVVKKDASMFFLPAINNR